MENLEKSEESKTFVLLHSSLMKKYLQLAEEKKGLLDFYYQSLELFDVLFDNAWHNFGAFINNKDKVISGRYVYIYLQTKNALDSFFSNYFTFKNGLCNSSTLTLRYCFETLLKNYFYLTLPIGEKDFIKYHTLKPEKIRKKLYIPETLEK